jgi:hypothetical protein
MLRINKNTPAGNLVIDGVLNLAWSEIENRYEGDLYYGLINSPVKNQLANLFLVEQANRCCYCMKEINAGEVSLEHIIPQRATLEEFNPYLTVSELSDTVIHNNNFDRNNLVIPPPRYPHDLGYNNLIASCDSSSHCNNKRGKGFISPFMYNDAMINDISYEPFGGLFTTSVEVEALKLNNDLLKMIRKLWYLIAKKMETLIGLNNKEDLQTIVDEIIANEDEKFIETFSGAASRVSEVFHYRWFFDYYKLNNN